MLASRILSCARAEYNAMRWDVKRASGCAYACARISPSRWIEAGSDTYPDSDTGSGSDSEFGSESCRYAHMHMRMHMNMNANRTPTCVCLRSTPEMRRIRTYVVGGWTGRMGSLLRVERPQVERRRQWATEYRVLSADRPERLDASVVHAARRRHYPLPSAARPSRLTVCP